MHSRQKIQKKLSHSKVSLLAQTILKEYVLCDYCTGRLFAKKLNLTSYKVLGKKLKNQFGSNSTQKKCHICNDIMNNLEHYLKKMTDTSSQYTFSTFLVGAVLKPSSVDKDDSVRSRFKLQGIDSLKTSITRELGKKFARKTKTTVDFLKPDVTLTINFKDNSCSIRSKPLFLFGRYTKNVRDIPQKQFPCEFCNGFGCKQCDYHGIADFESVEGKICKFLYEKFGAIQAKLTWVGGEDKTSLVLGKGRPFFVKLSNPKIRRKKPQKTTQNDISIKELRVIDQIPQEFSFCSRIEIIVTTKNPLVSENLKNLKKLLETPILIDASSGKTNRRLIHEIKYRKKSPNSFSLSIVVDGGFPVKRFVEDKNIKPNLSVLLDNICLCETFDFHEIKLK